MEKRPKKNRKQSILNTKIEISKLFTELEWMINEIILNQALGWPDDDTSIDRDRELEIKMLRK